MGYIGSGPTSFNTADDLTVTGDAEFNGNLTVKGTTTTIDSVNIQYFDVGDNDRIRLGDSQDLQIYHDGSHSYIKDAGDGDLILQGSDDVKIQTASGTNLAVFTEGTYARLFYNGTARFETTATGVDVTGTITFDGGTTSADLNFGDNDKAVFGAGSDLQIYHDGSASIVYDNGTGPLNLQTNNSNINIKGGGSASDTMAIFKSTEGVDLYYNNVKKFETTSTGINVTGEVQGDSLDIDGIADFTGKTTHRGGVSLLDNDVLSLGTSDDLQIYHDGSDSYIKDVGAGNLRICATNLKITNAADTEVYIDAFENGSVNLRYDNSAKLTTQSDGISVSGNVQASSGRFEGNSNQDRMEIGASQIDFYINDSNEFRMESDGDFHADGDVIAFSTTISDERLKTDITKIDSALDKVGQLNGYTFTYKQGGKQSAGVIAQEVEKVLPSAVSEKELPLKTDDGVAYKTVQYDQLVGLLIEAVNELSAKVAKLEGK